MIYWWESHFQIQIINIITHAMFSRKSLDRTLKITPTRVFNSNSSLIIVKKYKYDRRTPEINHKEI